MKKNIWLIGSGEMSLDYIHVLKNVNIDKFLIIGRGEESAKLCEQKTGEKVIQGGLESFLSTKPDICSHAIVSVGIEHLYEITKLLLEYGVKSILLEKPGTLYRDQIKELNAIAESQKANILIAYNRRFYASTLKCIELLEKEEVTSLNFEFTEWAHTIAPLEKGEGVKERWFLSNSTHVVDLAFFLGGYPSEIQSFTSGSLSWHPSASVFVGSGVTNKNILFNYQANWDSAGRWAVEVLTKQNKYIFKPMEKLQVQKKGTIAEEFINIDYSLDEEYKPGLYVQTNNFIQNNYKNMCTIKEQCEMMNIYMKMANYKD